mmetsp:Transcript_15601/g.25998  ORF Transcript_15601/g.25998 Transcript_15601/m.25998 type:complete len:1156 (-) Transcript_15601:213-3680(-)
MSSSESDPPPDRGIPSLFEQSTKESVLGPRPRSQHFLKKVMKWKSTQRKDNSHLEGLQPTHRAATLRAVEAGENLNKNIQNDFSSLENVEESLSAMQTYVEIGNAEVSTKNAIMDNTINVDDCIKVKNDTKEHVKNAQKAMSESQVTSAPVVEESAVSSPPRAPGPSAKKGGILGTEGGASEGGGLKLARLHNQARLNKLKQARQQQQKQLQQPAPTAPQPVPEPKDMTFLTGVTIEDKEEEQQQQQHQQEEQVAAREEPREHSEEQRVVPRASSQRPELPSVVPGHKVVSLPSQHSAAPLSSDDVHTPPEKPRPPPRLPPQPVELPVNTKLLATPIEHPLPQMQDNSQPLKLSKYNHHGQSAPSLSVHDVHALASTVVKRQHLASRSKSSARRGRGEAVHRNEDDDLLEEEVAERQLMWLMKVEAKNRAAKREKENRIIEELKIVPDITGANASWAKAKKSHAREINKEKEAENMKKKLDNMKSELHVLRLEEKAIRLRKVQQTRQMEMMGMGMGRQDLTSQGHGPRAGASAPPRKKKVKKKKKKERAPSVEKQQVVDSKEGESGAAAVSQQERKEIQQKFKQRIPVTARGRDEVSRAGDGGSGVKQLLRMKNRPKSANAVMKWSTLKSYDQKFDVLDMVLSPSQSEDGGGVFSQLPSSGRRAEHRGEDGVRRSRESPFRPAPSSGGWVDGTEGVKERRPLEKESFGDMRNSRVNINSSGHSRPSSATGAMRRSGDTAGDNHEGDYGLSMHEQYRQQQEVSQREYLAERPFLQQPNQAKKHAMPSDLSYDSNPRAQDNGFHQGQGGQQSLPHGSPRRSSDVRRSKEAAGDAHGSGNNDFGQPEVLDARIREMSERQAAIASRQEERHLRQEQLEASQQLVQQPEALRLSRQREETRRLQLEAQQHQRRIDEARQASLAQQSGRQHLGMASAHKVRHQHHGPEGVRRGVDMFGHHNDYEHEDDSVMSGVTEEGTFAESRVSSMRDHARAQSRAGASLGRTLFDNTPSGQSSALVPLSGSSSRSQATTQRIGDVAGESSVVSAAHSAQTDQESRSSAPLTARSNYSSSLMAGRFFDQTSTADKGRHRVHDARDFDTKSMFRKPDLMNDAVTLLMGKKRNSDAMDIITVLFDRGKFSEEGARLWWNENRDRLMVGQW